MAFQVSTTIDLANSALCVYLAARLYRAYLQDPKSLTLRNFSYTYVSLTMAYVLLIIPRLFASQQQLILGIAFAFGSFAFLIASSFFGQIVLAFSRPTWVKPFRLIYSTLAFLCLIWSLIDRAQPVVDVTTGITQWNVPVGVGAFSGFLLLIVLIPGVVLFFNRGIHTIGNHIVRVRSFTIGIGEMLLIFSAITFYLASSEILAIIGDLISIGALLTIFLGVIYHRPSPLPAPQPSSPRS
ncbi:MAG: hypothetical protein AAB424_02545 [Patescibacteria group bacterium]